MRPIRVILTLLGSLIVLVGFGFMAGGGALIWADQTQRDAAGYYSTPTVPVDTPTYALTSQVDFGATPGERSWIPAAVTGTIRIRAASAIGGAIFVGIAPRAQVDRWLAGVERAQVTSLGIGPFTTQLHVIKGTSVPTPPRAQRFWVTSSSGLGTQTITWPSQTGRWSIVVMDPNGARGVAALVTVGVNSGVLLPIGIGLTLASLFVLAAGAALLAAGLRRPRSGSTASLPDRKMDVAPSSRAYPVRLDGHLDPTTSRWLWVVKWLLVVPHLIVLACLWIAASLLTVVAGVAILFTGRYPRSIFDFNVGVFRWSWRVGFYASSAFGTDRYPPFTLEPDPTYPADLSIDYPQRLSRGLVLVKWWLLVLPHYVIVALFVGGLGLGGAGALRWVGGLGLISILAIVAAVIRGVRGEYPETIFDFVMGMNRWCARVLAYAALMCDEYPPFRLDVGGADPGSLVAPPHESGTIDAPRTSTDVAQPEP